MSTRTSLFARSTQLRVFQCPYRHHPRFSFSSAFLTTREFQPWSSRAAPFTTTIRRPYSVQLAHPIPVPTLLLSSPTPEQIEEEEIEVDLPPLKDIRLALTDRAAEQLRAIAAREKNPGAALRISVESGGCHGYQYKMELAKTRAIDDFHFTHPTIRPANLLVDAISLSFLNGSSIDFATELIGSSFRVMDNPQSKGSGCGCGVSWELKA